MTHHPMGLDGVGDGDESGVCLTADCVKVAANILTSADLTADPCEDFYQGNRDITAENGIDLGTFGAACHSTSQTLLTFHGFLLILTLHLLSS